MVIYFHQPAMANDSIKPVLPIATEHYPPYEMRESEKGLRGFDLEVVEEIFKRMGYRTDTRINSWKRVLRAARSGKIAGVITCAYRPERAEYMIFSDPISTFTNGFFMRKDYQGHVPNDLDEIQDGSVASVAGYESLQALRELNPKAQAVPTAETGLKMLMAKRFDFLYIGKEATQYLARRTGYADKITFHPITEKHFHFCFSRKWPDVDNLIVPFNKTLLEIQNDGTFEKIHSRYK